jgi:hypothetical protein
MDQAASRQIEAARALGAKIQFVLEPDNDGLCTLHAYAELCDELVSRARSGYVQVYGAHDPRRLVTEPMRDGDGRELRVEHVISAVDRAIAKYRSRSSA